MFSPPRFVVIDDKPHHLSAIINVFQALGAHCLGIQYDAVEGIKPELLAGVRALFVDLHLVDSAASTEQTKHYATIASLLEGAISRNGGPYVLALWTEYPNQCAELVAYLDRTLPKEAPHLHPLAVLPLSKSEFIAVNSGTEIQPGKLRAAVEAAVISNPQLSVMLRWEADVRAAAGATLASLQSLVPKADRSIDSFPTAFDRILSLLARESVGQPNVQTDVRAAIYSALAPILADRIVNQEADESSKALWKTAVTMADADGLDSEISEASQINRMLHFALPSGEAVRPTDWGAVVEYPASNIEDGAVSSCLGVDKKTLIEREFKLKVDKAEFCVPCLVRVGATCDHAQGQAGPIPYVLGFIAPVDAVNKSRPPKAVWKSPTFQIEQDGSPTILIVNARFMLSHVASEMTTQTVRFRIREQLLMDLIVHLGNYMSRPGIIQLANR